jgi:glycosyltransferase involved in cell wall biosynthesis
MGKFVTYFETFQSMYLGKEVFVVPLYLSKLLNLDCDFYYGANIGSDEIPSLYRGILIHNMRHERVSKLMPYFDILKCIIFKARKIDCIFFVHTDHAHILGVIMYKILNPKGKAMVMADMDSECADNLAKHNFVFSKGLKGFLKRKIINQFFSKLDVFSVETLPVYNIVKEMFTRNNWHDLAICNPGIDDDLIKQYNIKVKEYNEKNNVILYVGRIGPYQKNNEMLFKSLENIDFQGWKVILLGPITDDFSTKNSKASNINQYIDDFYRRNPHLVDKVILTGAIYEKEKIYEYYNDAKVFILTSRYEGYCNSLSDAAGFGCFIMSTDVGGASLVTNGWKYGVKLNQEDSSYLASKISEVINNEIDIDVYKGYDRKSLSYERIISENVIPLLIDK